MLSSSCCKRAQSALNLVGFLLATTKNNVSLASTETYNTIFRTKIRVLQTQNLKSATVLLPRRLSDLDTAEAFQENTVRDGMRKTS